MISRVRTIGLATAVLWSAAAGCGSAPPAPAKGPTAQADPSPTNPPEPAEATKQAAAPQKNETPKQADSKVEIVPPAELAKPKTPRDEPQDRLLLFTRQGPLVVQFRFEIDGRPLADVRADLIAQMLALSDSDGDGRTSWPEAIASPWFVGDRANTMSGESMGKRSPTQSLERIHDRNLDGFLDQVEAARLASANDVAAGTFRLESEARSQGADPTQSAVWMLIDTDEDRAIGSEELERMAALLKSRDADDNDLLEMAELNPSPAAVAAGQERMETSVTQGHPRVVQLGSRARWDSLVSALAGTYQEDQRLVLDRFPLALPLVRAADRNQDGQIDRDEIRGLNEAPAHATIAVRFGEKFDVEVVHAAEAIGPCEVRPGSDPRERLIRLPQLDVELRLRDEAAGFDASQLVKSQFMALDGDANGYLDGDEFIAAGATVRQGFASVDRDGNGKITLEELMQLAGKQQAFLAANVRARPADANDAGWASLDADGDGRLSLREIRGAAAHLLRLDADRDGRVTSGEMPSSLMVRIERSLAQSGTAPQPLPAMNRPPTATAASPGPPWFDRMDSNADGDVSPREFLGTPEQFQTLDVDRDGYISRSEAARQG